MDRFKRMRSASSDLRGSIDFKSKSIVDRETYTKFMEQELEKVISAFMQVKHLPERMEQLQNQIILNQEKITNMSRILNLVQDTENNQENDIHDMKVALRKLGVSATAVKDREYSNFKSTQVKNETHELIERIRNIEDRLTMPVGIKSQDRSEDEYKHFAVNVEQSLFNLEQKLVNMITQRLPQEQPRSISDSKKNARSRSKSKSPGKYASKKKSISSTPDKTSTTDFKAIENLVNNWTEKIEEQVNIIQDN